jgi:hypothetical protein
MIKSRRMTWTGHVAHIKGIRNEYKFWSENIKGGDYLGGIGLDRRIIFKCILKKLGMKVWIGFIWLQIGYNGGHL